MPVLVELQKDGIFIELEVLIKIRPPPNPNFYFMYDGLYVVANFKELNKEKKVDDKI